MRPNGRFADAITELREFEPILGTYLADAQGLEKAMIVTAPKNLPSVAAALAGDRDTAFAYVEKATRSPKRMAI